jgi:hypothetical protein
MPKQDDYILIVDDTGKARKRKAVRRRRKPSRQPVPQQQEEEAAASESGTSSIPVPVPPPAPEYTRPNRFEVRGATAPDGTPWVHIIPMGSVCIARDDSGPAPHPGVWTRSSDWMDDAGPAKRRLKAANVILFGEQLKEVVRRAQDVREFPAVPLVEHSGWTKPHFALPSGHVFSPVDAEPAVVLFEKDAFRCATRGNMEAWLDGIARLAAGQSIISFGLMLPFMAPVLSLSAVLHNPGFELTGPPRRGKSSLQQLLASTCGPAVDPHGRNYLLPANMTVNALEESTQQFADLPIIIEEMGLFYAAEPQNVRAAKTLESIMRLASGTVKARRGEPTPRAVRFIYITSSNVTISSLFGEHQGRTGSAAKTRLLTIPIAGSRKYGIFDKLPGGCASSSEAIDRVVELVADHHGLAIRVFLKELAARRAADEAALKSRIEALIDDFRNAVGVDDNAGPESSIADVFGLAYAAGTLAQEFGALPAKLELLRSTIKVYHLYRAASAPPPSNLELLQRLAKRKGVLRVEATNLPKIADEDLARAPALLRTDRNGSRVLLLTDAALRRAFPVPSRLFVDPEVKALMRTDKDQRKKWTVRVRTNRKQERFHAFVLTNPSSC